VHADRGQRIAHLVQLERLDHRHDDFHGLIPCGPPSTDFRRAHDIEAARQTPRVSQA
jgi:hypothetical protein